MLESTLGSEENSTGMKEAGDFGRLLHMLRLSCAERTRPDPVQTDRQRCQQAKLSLKKHEETTYHNERLTDNDPRDYMFTEKTRAWLVKTGEKHCAALLSLLKNSCFLA